MNRGNSDKLLTRHPIPIRNDAKVNNIQDILNQEEDFFDEIIDQKQNASPLKLGSSPNNGGRVKFVGTYRHPKEFSPMMKMFSSNIPVRSQQQPEINKFISDPFHNYKPKSPSDVNLMALNQFRFAPAHQPHKPIISPYFTKFYNNHQDTDDFVELSYDRINATKSKNADYSEFGRILNRNIERKSTQRPFSLMLDIYPMSENDPKKSHLNSNIDAINALKHQSHLKDQSYFNSMIFPQLQSLRRPMTQNYYNSIMSRYPGAAFQATKFASAYEQSQDDDTNNNEKPGKMVVHLNLHPRSSKKKTKNRNVEIIEERSSTRDIENEDYSNMTTTPEMITTTMAPEPTITIQQIIVSNQSSLPNQNHPFEPFANFNNTFITIHKTLSLESHNNESLHDIPSNHRPEYFSHPSEDQMIKFNSKDIIQNTYSERDFLASLNLNEKLS